MQQNPGGFVQQPCSKCGTVVWISPAAGVGYCPSCHTPNQIAAGAGGAAPGVTPGAMPFPVATPGFPVMKIVGIVAGAIALTVLSVGGYFVKTALFGAGGKGNIGYAQLGIDPKSADPDAMITSVSGLATKWKKDAAFWSASFQYVGADGRLDLSKGGATVQYVSLNSAKSAAKSVNKDAIKDFDFAANGVRFNSMRGTAGGKPWPQNAKSPPLPTCGIKSLVEKLKPRGLVPGKTVRITFDPTSIAMPAELSWRVVSEELKIDSHYSIATCAQTK
jgi:hypothetical protein